MPLLRFALLFYFFSLFEQIFNPKCWRFINTLVQYSEYPVVFSSNFMAFIIFAIVYILIKCYAAHGHLQSFKQPIVRASKTKKDYSVELRNKIVQIMQ